MKHRSLIFLTVFSLLLFDSCIFHTDYGPDGRDGRAYFGVDYHFQPPYSYWDDNPFIPENPVLGAYYETLPGTYSFEYFVNPFDYWYGTYQIWIERGTEGGPYGEAGMDGLDTYLILYCDPHGWHEEFFTYPQGKVNVTREKDHVRIEVNDPGHYFVIEMTRTDILNRKPQSDGLPMKPSALDHSK
jgi:hypothetical protein